MIKKIIDYVKLFWIALRPLSLTLAFASTSYGILAAFINGFLFTNEIGYDIILIILVTLAGLASQAGANLINDYFEGSFKYHDKNDKVIKFLGRDRTPFDIFVFLSGIAALCFAGLVGIYLIYITNYWMLIIGLIGLVGSYAYTGEPFVYKKRGLGVPLSFILMGPLMTLGAYYPFAKSFSLTPILIGIPGSLLIPALMLSNEMRDFERDNRLSLGTLSVRIGSIWSSRLYIFLLVVMYLFTIVLVIVGTYPTYALLSFLTLPVAIIAGKHVKKFERLSIPTTNKLHFTFNIFILLSIIISIILN